MLYRPLSKALASIAYGQVSGCWTPKYFFDCGAKEIKDLFFFFFGKNIALVVMTSPVVRPGGGVLKSKKKKKKIGPQKAHVSVFWGPIYFYILILLPLVQRLCWS